MTRLVLFGAGLAAPSVIKEARKYGEILAIADNDPAKWGSTLQGLPIVPPREIDRLSPEEVVISATATYPIYRQLIQMGIPEDHIKAPLLHPTNRATWATLENAHQGKRIFIIGNGPSLLFSDLDRIHQSEDLSFAFNKIYLSFEETSYRPSYYLVDDNLVAKNNVAAIHSLSGFQKFYPDYLLPVLGKPDKETALFYYAVQNPDQFQPSFSTDPLILHSGYSCTYSALQIAVLMGCNPIVFIGLDFSFTLPEQRHGQVLTNESEQNHFSPNYRKPGEAWNLPYLEQTRRAYQFAKQLADTKGISILNASRSSQLDVFPKVDFDSLFQD